VFETTAILAATSSSSSTGFNPSTLLLPLLLIGGLYFLMIRPQQRQRQQAKQLQTALDVGDEVMTTSGLIGTIVEMDDDTVVLEISEGVEVRFVRQAVSRKWVYDDEDEAYEDSDEDGDQEDDGDEDEPAREGRGGASPNGRKDDSHKGPWFDDKADGAEGAGGQSGAAEGAKGAGGDT
jgi:preprotein translocase subunit YajC